MYILLYFLYYVRRLPIIVSKADKKAEKKAKNK